MPLDLPPVPPPRLPRPKLSKGITLLTGCGLGIGVVVVAMALLIVLAFVVLPSRMAPRARLFTDATYAKAESNKNLTKDQLKVYGEILAIVDAPESSVFAVNVGGATLYDHLKDGAISGEEIAEATGVKAALAADPAGGVLAFMGYVRRHPDMQQKVNVFTREIALSGIGR